MARVEIPLIVLHPDTGEYLEDADVTIQDRTDETNATVYANETGGATVTLPIATDAQGRVEGWVARGRYLAEIVATGLPTTTVAFDAVPGQDEGIDTEALADAAVTSDKIADNAVGATEIADNSIDAAALQSNAVTTAKILADAVTSTELGADAVDSSALRDDASTDSNRAVTANHIRDGAVGNSKLATDAVTAAKIAADAVTSSEILAKAVTTPKLFPTYGFKNSANSTVSISLGTGYTLLSNITSEVVVPSNSTIFVYGWANATIQNAGGFNVDAAAFASIYLEGTMISDGHEFKMKGKWDNTGTNPNFDSMLYPIGYQTNVTGATLTLELRVAAIGSAGTVSFEPQQSGYVYFIFAA